MADLNPSLENEDKKIFDNALKEISRNDFEEGVKQGEKKKKILFIPALNRHRGISQFYLENYKTDDKKEILYF